jgi:hypothetical protein
MLESLCEPSFVFQDISETAHCAGTFWIYLDCLRVFYESFFNACICFEQVTLNLVSTFIHGVHRQNLVTNLHTVVVSSHSSLQQS